MEFDQFLMVHERYCSAIYAIGLEGYMDAIQDNGSIYRDGHRIKRFTANTIPYCRHIFREDLKKGW